MAALGFRGDPCLLESPRSWSESSMGGSIKRARENTKEALREQGGVLWGSAEA